ncbi:mitochondrial sodium/hydrogen exchanger NHA2 [Trypanosoma rangeli]|uniref:Mitochondrial sodium/hydrogen exchanger NHA2 n=1 Tax=Trypanosoma rangeli TaxID=5698 RepID=A0A3R7NWD7_TRYRA|nr:mitochondrial sodium/hydrogen exchanger NHA2 [Trypanosoma rangeli]RNF08757.1 mitochondrial sodium/hydrogen exchanger NHA2 [Trypanosoma rangeli]|eukprot:RNF08757.1 mitochondrial sodium/hydrogen exchanger NHA2 [Trypanosoma rangeli]
MDHDDKDSNNHDKNGSMYPSQTRWGDQRHVPFSRYCASSVFTTPLRVGSPLESNVVPSSTGSGRDSPPMEVLPDECNEEKNAMTMCSELCDTSVQQNIARSCSPIYFSNNQLKSETRSGYQSELLVFPLPSGKGLPVLEEVTALPEETETKRALAEAGATREGLVKKTGGHPLLEDQLGAFSNVPTEDTKDAEFNKIATEAFNGLSSDNRRFELLQLFWNMYFQPFERNRSYTGDTWDEFKRIGHSDTCCGFEFDRERFSMHVTVMRRKYRFFPFSFLLRAIFLVLFWTIMYSYTAKPFLPGGLYFDTIATVLFSGLVGCFIARFLPVPSLVFIIAAGFLYGNIPRTAYLTSGITMPMRNFINTLSVAVGVIRSGLSINLNSLRKRLIPYLAFGVLPLFSEALVHGFLCKVAYNYPNYIWAMMQGFLVSAVAPSVAGPFLIDLQEKGCNIQDGPGMLMLTSVSIEAPLCVFIVQLIISLEFKTTSTLFAILLVPLQLVVAVIGGVLLGGMMFFFFCYVLSMEAEKIPLGNGCYKRMTLRHATHVRYVALLFFLLLGMAIVSVSRILSCTGGGIFMLLVMTCTFNILCLRGGNREYGALRGELVQSFATVWDYAVMPALFAFTGADVELYEVFDPKYLGPTIGIIFAGIMARFVFSVLTPIITRMGFSWRELILCGFGYLGKGSLQGPLSTVALTCAYAHLDAAKSLEEIAEAKEQVAYSRLIRNAAVLSTLIASSICSIFLWNFAERLLKPKV